MNIWEDILAAVRAKGGGAVSTLCANVVLNNFLQNAFTVNAVRKAAAPINTAIKQLAEPPIKRLTEVPLKRLSAPLKPEIIKSVAQPRYTPPAPRLGETQKSAAPTVLREAVTQRERNTRLLAASAANTAYNTQNRHVECRVNMTNNNTLTREADIDEISRSLARRISEELSLIEF